MDDAGQIVSYVFTDPPLAGAPAPVTLRQGAGNLPEIVAAVAGENAEATETYVFTLLEPDVAATPAP